LHLNDNFTLSMRSGLFAADANYCGVGMNNNVKLAVLGVVAGFLVSISSFAVARSGMTQGARDALRELNSQPAPVVASTDIPNAGDPQEIAFAKATLVGLINSDIRLDGMTREQINDSVYVNSSEAKQARLKALQAIWVESMAASRFEKIQSALESGIPEGDPYEPMQSGSFEVQSWHGVNVSNGTMKAIVFGHKIEVTESRTFVQPDEFLEITVAQDSVGTWKLASIAHRQTESY
jgi:hypothetical protein